MSTYRGRFAPSPTGPLHLGSLAAALASWLDARAHDGVWLIRMEDVDEPRCRRDVGIEILKTLAAFGLTSPEPVVWQSQRKALYDEALSHLRRHGHVYPCACTRRELAQRPCPCRGALPRGRSGRAWRFRSPGAIDDAVLHRADGYHAYQLAVVVDDHLQGITHVVRGDDLLDSTPGQIALQQALGYPTPEYFHIPVIRDAAGAKLSKQNSAPAVATMPQDHALAYALSHLGLDPPSTLADWQPRAIAAWRARRSAHPPCPPLHCGL